MSESMVFFFVNAFRERKREKHVPEQRLETYDTSGGNREKWKTVKTII